MNHCLRLLAPVLAAVLVAPLAAGQELDDGALTLRPLRGNLQLVVGPGSNVVVSSGKSGTLLVDDEYAKQGEMLLTILGGAAVPAKVVINTHWHNDHTGNNELLGRGGARIIAQARSAQRMHSDQVMSLYGPQPAYPAVAWPATEVSSSMKLDWNGDVIEMLHIGPAHTDGDLVVYFRRQNVLVTGDLFVTGDYLPPYFDDRNGGTGEGMIVAAERLLKIANDKTLIVPGHGPVTDRKALERYHDGFAGVRARIREAIGSGMSEDAVVALHPGAGFAPAGRGTDRWVRILYREYSRPAAGH